jgi:hypothetical protein
MVLPLVAPKTPSVNLQFKDLPEGNARSWNSIHNLKFGNFAMDHGSKPFCPWFLHQKFMAKWMVIPQIALNQLVPPSMTQPQVVAARWTMPPCRV